jgi:hypothetical protein
MNRGRIATYRSCIGSGSHVIIGVGIGIGRIICTRFSRGAVAVWLGILQDIVIIITIASALCLMMISTKITGRWD